jgi:hypothetical protein
MFQNAMGIFTGCTGAPGPAGPRSQPGRFAAADGRRAVSLDPNDPFLLGDGVHQPHRVALDEPGEFGFEGSEVAGLELDELSAASQVNLEAINAGFQSISTIIHLFHHSVPLSFA